MSATSQRLTVFTSVSRYLACAAVLMLVALGASAPASSATRYRADDFYGTPALDGSRVAWLEQAYRSRSSRFTVVTVTRGSLTRRVVADPNPSMTLTPSAVALRGDDVAVTATRQLYARDPDPRAEPSSNGNVVYVARQLGAFEPFLQCQTGRGFPDVAFTADHLVTRSPGCEPLVVRSELDQPAEPLSQRGLIARSAGHLVAWIEPPEGTASELPPRGDVVVYDLRRRSEVYRLAANRIPGQVSNFDVDVDGSVAVSLTGRGDNRAATMLAGPGRKPRVLPLPPADSYDSRLEDGRLLVMRRLRSGRWELRHVTDGGRSSRRVAFDVSGFDFDGKTVAFGVLRCGRGNVYVATLKSLRAMPFKPRSC